MCLQQPYSLNNEPVFKLCSPLFSFLSMQAHVIATGLSPCTSSPHSPSAFSLDLKIT